MRRLRTLIISYRFYTRLTQTEIFGNQMLSTSDAVGLVRLCRSGVELNIILIFQTVFVPETVIVGTDVFR